MVTKKHVLRIAWVLEMACFIYFYLFGAYGLTVLSGVRAENQAYQAELADMRFNIAGLQGEVDRWKHDDFLREKIAREELQMVGAGEQVYYLNS
jgi:cell division protein FtsB